MEIPVAWILGTLTSLGGVIATLAVVIWRTLQSRLDAQDTLIEHFRKDIDRLSKGCGVETCHWRNR